MLRYLSGGAGVGLPYKKSELEDLWRYVNADHTSCPGLRREEKVKYSC